MNRCNIFLGFLGFLGFIQAGLAETKLPDAFSQIGDESNAELKTEYDKCKDQGSIEGLCTCLIKDWGEQAKCAQLSPNEFPSSLRLLRRSNVQNAETLLVATDSQSKGRWFVLGQVYWEHQHGKCGGTFFLHKVQMKKTAKGQIISIAYTTNDVCSDPNLEEETKGKSSEFMIAGKYVLLCNSRATTPMWNCKGPIVTGEAYFEGNNFFFSENQVRATHPPEKAKIIKKCVLENRLEEVPGDESKVRLVSVGKNWKSCPQEKSVIRTPGTYQIW